MHSPVHRGLLGRVGLCVKSYLFEKILLFCQFLPYPTTPLRTKPYPYPTFPKTHPPPDRRKADPPPIVWLLAHVCVTPSNSNICSKQSANAKRNEGEGETETLFGMSHPTYVAFSPKFIYCIFLHKFAQMIWKLM